MKIYNTFTEKKELLRKPWFRKLKMFVCGPTVYDDPHIGNARTFIMFDVFARFLRSRGFRLFFLQNITDIDDKIIDRAKAEGVSPQTLATRYEKVFLENMYALGITSITKYARATHYIPQIVTQVNTLIKKGHVYLIEGDGYYFDLSTFPDYGKLAHRTVAQAEDGVSRIDSSSNKRNVGDFCVWKFSNESEPGWDTKLGFGRPGWHIEDTAITEHFFGPQYDIHGGAADLKFPHHEAEIAQQESASGKKPFVTIWMHSGFLTVNGEKMSKSKGNFITVHDLLANYSPEAFRLAILMHHYRSPLDYTSSLMETAETHIDSFNMFLAKLEIISSRKHRKKPEEQLPDIKTMFYEAMEDDLNTPKAIATIFDLLTHLNPRLWTMDPVSAHTIHNLLSRTILKSLGLELKLPSIPQEINNLAREREKSRASQQFAHADDLRKRISALGYVVEDTPIGPFLWPLRKPH